MPEDLASGKTAAKAEPVSWASLEEASEEGVPANSPSGQASNRLMLQLKDLLLWNPFPPSAAIFVAGNFIFLLSLSGVTLPYMAGAGLLWLLILGNIYVNISKLAVGFLGPHALKRPKLGIAYIDKATAIGATEVVIDGINGAIDTAMKACWEGNFRHTARLILLAWCVKQIGRVISATNLVYTVFLVAFIAPLGYQARKSDIEALGASLRERVAVHRVSFEKKIRQMQTQVESKRAKLAQRS